MPDVLLDAAAEEARHGEALAVVADERGRAVGKAEDARQIARAKAAELAVHGVARKAAAADVDVAFGQGHERRVGQAADLRQIRGTLAFVHRQEGTGKTLKNHGRTPYDRVKIFGRRRHNPLTRAQQECILT